MYRPDDSLTNDNEEILELQLNFYKNLYTAKDINDVKANKFTKNLPKLTDEMRNRICREIIDSEIAEALLALPNNKAPGSDGFTADFYKFFWPDLKTFVCNSIKFAIQSGTLSIDQKRGVITLIPKAGKDLRFLKNWRPISLLNTDYKILAKLLATRLQPILPDIISKDQSAYIKGRSITDNIRSVWDVLDVSKLTKKQLYIIFIDFEKAFDTVSHEFLIKCLEKLNFGTFIDLVKLLYNDAQSCVSHRGFHSEYFHISRGVRQGDPLSSLLFIILLESFANTLRDDKAVDGFRYKTILKKIFSYADDMSLLAGNQSSCERCFHLLNDFELASGLKLNMDKTEGFSINCKPIAQIKIKWNPENFKYLGILICPDTAKAQKLNLDRAMKLYSNALQMWSHRKLTFTGKKTILNVNALSKINHILVPIYVPQEYFAELNKCAREFLWNKSNSKIAFDDIIKPLSEGGLNFPSPENRIKAQKLTWLKKILLENDDSIWKTSFCEKLSFPLEMIGLGSTNFKILNDNFVNQILKIWKDVSCINKPTTKKQILNEPLWMSSFVINKNNKKSLFLKNWLSAGFRIVGDMWDFQLERWKTKNELASQIQLLTDFQYDTVIKSIDIYKNVLRGSTIELLNYRPKIKTHEGFLDLLKASSKNIYTVMVLAKKDRPAHENALQNIFNCQLDWKSIYAMASQVTNNAYLLQTQFKLNHNILPTNERLSMWRKSASPHCICGMVDTNVHYTVQCKLIQSFWGKIRNFIKMHLDVDFRQSDSEIFFGISNPLDDAILNSINFINICAKAFIWKEKRWGKPCLMHDFLPYLREQLLIESSSKLFKHKNFVAELLSLI